MRMNSRWMLIALLWAAAQAGAATQSADAVSRPWPCWAMAAATASLLQPAVPSGLCGSVVPAQSSLRLESPASTGTAAPLVAPSSPTNLAAVVSGRTVTFTWTPAAGSDAASSFVLEAGSATGLSNLANTDTGSSVASLTASDVPAGTYFVRVKARNSAGTSAASNEVIVTVSGGACTVAPGAPTGLVASVSGTSLTLTWQAPSGGCTPTAYTIEAGSGPTLSNLASFSTGSTARTFSATAVATGTYYVRVRATNGTAASGVSNEVQFSTSSGTCTAAPQAPTGFGAQVSGLTIVFSWTASSGSPTTYILEAGSITGSSNLAVSDLGSTATTFSATAGAGTYYVRLRAKNSCGTSAASAEIVVTTPSTTATDLVFIPDAGFRKGSASVPSAGVDASGTVYLYYSDTTSHQVMVATATDGLTFGVGTAVARNAPTNHANDSRRTRLPDSTWRLYSFQDLGGVLGSLSSADGITFLADPGTRYAPVAADHGWIGVFDAFTEGSRVILLYLGDAFGVNNLRRAVSTDNGVTFTFDRADVLGDAALGTTNTYVDPMTIKLPDGRRRLFVMKNVAGLSTSGGEIDSFISSNGLDYTLEAGNRVKLADFTSAGININSLNDPVVVRLADGRYRMYVSARVTSTNELSIVSATTRP